MLGFLFLFGVRFLPSISPEGCGFWNAVPNNFPVACVLVSLFVFVLNNVCGWKKVMIFISLEMHILLS